MLSDVLVVVDREVRDGTTKTAAWASKDCVGNVEPEMVKPLKESGSMMGVEKGKKVVVPKME